MSSTKVIEHFKISVQQTALKISNNPICTTILGGVCYASLYDFEMRRNLLTLITKCVLNSKKKISWFEVQYV